MTVGVVVGMQYGRRTLTRQDWTRILAYALRRNPTRSETILWQRLRRRQRLGFGFRRQAPVGRWIADFYCPAARLVVELDGASHRGQEAKDKLRDKTMAEMGLNVLRIPSSLVFRDLDSAIGQIEWALQRSGADPVTEEDACRLRMADETWEFSESALAHAYVRRRLEGLGFEIET